MPFSNQIILKHDFCEFFEGLLKISNWVEMFFSDMSFFTSQSNQSSTEETDSSIQTFSLCPSHKNLLVLGRNNGAVETWDTSAKCPRNGTHVTGAVTKIVFPTLSQEPICLITTSSGSVFCFDSLTGSILRKFQGHSDAIHDLILSDDEKFFVTCSDDCTVKLFLLSWINLLSIDIFCSYQAYK